MEKGFYQVPQAVNEPILSYAPGSSERAEVQAAYDKMWAESIDIPMVINGEEIRTGKTMRVLPPHDHQHDVGSFHFGTAQHVHDAIEAALNAKLGRACLGPIVRRFS